MIKGDILRVGYVDDEGKPQNWHFDCRNGVYGLTYTNDENILYAGYLIEELRFISLRQ